MSPYDQTTLTPDGWRHEWSGHGFLAGLDGVGR